MSEAVHHSDWGTVTAELGVEVSVALGTLEVALLRSAADWTTTFQYRQDVFWNASDDWRNEWRTAVAETRPDLLLRPASPPRNVVARPLRDLFIPAGGTATLYVGFPAWLQVVTGDELVLADLATELMSETWLGPNTRRGQVAFATQTQARLSYENLPQTRHTVRAPISIVNESSERLHISRLSIPAPQLPIFHAEDRLWSAPVSVVCEEQLAQARVEIGDAAPDFLDAAERLADARVAESESTVERAIGFLFS